MSLFDSKVNIIIGINIIFMLYLIEKEYKNIKVIMNEVIIVKLNCIVMVIGYVMGFFFNDFYMIVILGVY